VISKQRGGDNLKALEEWLGVHPEMRITGVANQIAGEAGR
jgi:hypothetical protein